MIHNNDEYIDNYFTTIFRLTYNEHLERNYHLENVIREYSAINEALKGRKIEYSQRINIHNRGNYEERKFNYKPFVTTHKCISIDESDRLTIEDKSKCSPLNQLPFMDLVNYALYSGKSLEDIKNEISPIPGLSLLNSHFPVTKLLPNLFIETVIKHKHPLYIDARQINNKCIVIPYASNGQICYPNFLQTTLYGLSHLSNELNQNIISDKILVITDQVDLAIKNQTGTNRSRKNIVWISWFGNDESISGIDWSSLNGATSVYYLLRENSGKSILSIWETACLVHNKVKEVCTQEVKFISYLDNFDIRRTVSNLSTQYPIIFRFEQLSMLVQFSASYHTNGITQPQFNKLNSHLAKSSELILEPIIFESSSTILTGLSGIGKTFFALNMAFGMALGKRVLESWCTGNKARSVIYLYSGLQNSRLGDQFNIIKNVYQARCHRNGPSYNQELPLIIDIDQEFFGVNFGLSDQELTYQYNLCKVKSFLHRQQSNLQKAEIVIIDDLLTGILGVDAVNEVNRIIREYRSKGVATVFVCGMHGIDHKEKALERSFLETTLTDNCIEVTRAKKQHGHRLSMKVKITKSLKDVKSSDKSFSCELTKSDKEPTFIKVAKARKLAPFLSKPQAEQDLLLSAYFANNASEAEISQKFKIGRSLVAKRRDIWRCQFVNEWLQRLHESGNNLSYAAITDNRVWKYLPKMRKRFMTEMGTLDRHKLKRSTPIKPELFDTLESYFLNNLQ